jgi:hypothetical protein
VNLSRLFNIYDGAARPDLKFRTYVPRELRLTAKSHDLFEECGVTIFCCTIRTILTMPFYRSFNRRPKTSACSRSSRLFTARASIR